MLTTGGGIMSTVDRMRYRPRVAHVLSVAAFCVAAPVLAFVWDGPLYIQVIGVCFGVVSPVYLWATLRTFIEIDSASVTRRGTRGPVTTFLPGDTTVKITEAISGLTSFAPVVTLRRRSDGRYAATPLHSFSREARSAIPRRIRAALKVSSETAAPQ